MEDSEDVRTCRGHTSAGDGPADRKLYFLSNELRNFNFNVAGVQDVGMQEIRLSTRKE